LIVEVDGGQHAENPADEARDARMRRLGYRVHVWNNNVLANIEGVPELLKLELEIAPHPVPLPVNGEREPGC
jgi:very-short-patch-repair endonuclease